MDYRELARKQTAEVEAKIAQFTNYTKEAFTGYWDGKPYTYQPGQQKVMQAFKAFHFAEGLANRELLRIKIDPKTGEKMRLPNGTPMYEVPHGDAFVSPKDPEGVPEFKNRFLQAFKMIDDGGSDEIKPKAESVSSDMLPIEKGKDVQIANFPTDPEDDTFEGTPEEETTPPSEPKTT